MTATPSEPTPITAPHPAGEGASRSARIHARRLHPLAAVLETGTATLRALPALVALFIGRAGPLLVALMAALAVAGVLRWWRTTYSLANGVLRIDSGIFTRSRRLIPLDRIHQVDTTRLLRHRLTGLAAVRIELAGSGDADVELDGLSLARAEQLELALRPAAPAPSRTLPLLELSPGLLMVGGITGTTVLAAPAVALSAVNLADDLALDLTDLAPRSAPAGAAIVAWGIAAVLVWLASSAAIEAVRYHGFTLSRSEGELRLVRGLLDQRSTTVNPGRLQLASVRRNLLRRLFGLAGLRLQSAAAAGSDDDVRLGVPVMRAADLDRVLARIGLEPVADMRPHPRAARRRALVRRLAPALVLASVLVAPGGIGMRGVVLIAGVGTVAALVGWMAGRRLGHAEADSTVQVRRGAVFERVDLVPVDKVQSVRVSSSPVQRRQGLATVHFDVAGPRSSVSVPDVSVARARALAGRALGRSRGPLRRH